MDYSGGVGTPIWQGRRRKGADGMVLCVGYLYSGVGGKGGGIRLHIAEFPKLVLAARGFFFNVCRRHGGGPMTGTRAVASAFILATSLASVAFAQQPPKPAACHSKTIWEVLGVLPSPICLLIFGSGSAIASFHAKPSAA